MIASPKTTPWIPGSTLPSFACRISPTGMSITEPITGPHTVPIPPNNVTTSACAEVIMPNTVGGVTMRRITA